MPRFSANLGFLWPELPLVERIHAASRAGFAAVECHFPYDTDSDEVRQALAQTGLPMLSLNAERGDPDKEEFGLAALPGREVDARAAIDKAIAYARAIDAQNVHVMAGTAGDGEAAIQCYLDNLEYAAREAGEHGVGILIEPINRLDWPGYTLHTVGQAIEIVSRIRARDPGLDNLQIMFDCYHVQRTDGNLATQLENALHLLGHIQIAAVPGRHEPDQGEINYPWLFELLDKLDYPGFVGAEYVPATTTDEGMGWHNSYRIENTGPRGGAVVYNGLTRQQLDAEYDNREKVSDAAEHLAWYTAESEKTRQTMRCELGLSYGRTADETLDLFFPNGETGEGATRPVHVFFHGGYWRALHKDHFSYVANALSATNGICAVVNYALVPDVSFDQLVDQCRHAVAWLWQHISYYGGDPNRITVSGHSAGGHLVAMMIATHWPQFHRPCPADLIKGGVSISGLMNLEPIRLSFLNEDLGLDEQAAQRNSPIWLSHRGNSELICYYGSLEGDEYRKQSQDLAANWPNTEAYSLSRHNHFTIARELNNPESDISRRIQRQMGL